MIDLLRQIGQPINLQRGSYLFRQGDLDERLFLVDQGLIKVYYETHDGKHFVKSFIKEGEFIGSTRAIIDGQPSTFTTLCIEQCKLLAIPKAKLIHAIASVAGAAAQLNSLLLKLASKKEQREYELLCLAPQARYLALCQREPDLIERLSQQDIASYLGITAVSLSRIRKRCRETRLV